MQILFRVNQAAALRLGFDAPSSTVSIDINPAELTQSERDYLADSIANGFDATQRIPWPKESYASTDPGSGCMQILSLVRPDLQGVREAIAQHQAQRVEFLEDKARQKTAKAAEADAEIDAAISARTTRDILVALVDGAPRVVQWPDHRRPEVTITVPSVSVFSHTRDSASPGGLARLHAAEEAAQAETTRLITQTRPALEQIAAELKAKDDALKAEYYALYSRLPAALRARDADGWAPKREVDEALQDLMCTDAGYTAKERWTDEAKAH